MTEHILKLFGFQLTSCPKLKSFKTFPKSEKTSSYSYTVENDWSTACYFFAIAFVSQKKLTISKLSCKTLQADVLFLNFLSKLGAEFTFEDNQITIHRNKEHLKHTKLFFDEDL